MFSHQICLYLFYVETQPLCPELQRTSKFVLRMWNSQKLEITLHQLASSLSSHYLCVTFTVETLVFLFNWLCLMFYTKLNDSICNFLVHK